MNEFYKEGYLSENSPFSENTPLKIEILSEKTYNLIFDTSLLQNNGLMIL